MSKRSLASLLILIGVFALVIFLASHLTVKAVAGFLLVLTLIVYIYRHSRKRHQAFRNYINDEYLEDGYSLIEIKIDENYPIFHPLSTNRGLSLNPEITDYLEMRGNIVPNNLPLKIRFYGVKDQHEEIKTLLSEHFLQKKYDIAWDIALNRRRIIFLTAIGVIFLSLYLFLAITDANALFVEILGIIGSFAFWEAFDYGLLEGPELKQKSDDNQWFVNAIIEFE